MLHNQTRSPFQSLTKKANLLTLFGRPPHADQGTVTVSLLSSATAGTVTVDFGDSQGGATAYGALQQLPCQYDVCQSTGRRRRLPQRAGIARHSLPCLVEQPEPNRSDLHGLNWGMHVVTVDGRIPH